jgi:2-polyprenyl-3-methyl-5-hydroxy-6-metoxy-1,4-benzoquinol methylase
MVGAAMREWYEEIWRELADELDAPDFESRRDHLVAHVRPGQRVLDLGCGDGPFIPALLEAGADVTGADIAEGALERARRRAPEARYVRIEPHGPWPFGDGEFELVWASEVLEHVADTERWINEVRRVLAPGGSLLVTTPSVGALAEPPDPRGQHLRFYSVRSLRGLLEDMGFGDVDVRAASGLLLGVAIR